MKKFGPLPLFVLLAILVASPRAQADEAAAQKCFHDAYVLEVIEGQVAEAAKVYLVLMEDAEVSKRLRAEARFRFAVCAVLLGRADEGRAHLLRLSEDADAAAALRSRAREYLDSVAGVGIGTELEKKLQSLVFDLGRVTPNLIQVPVYRDFEIIGKASIPFLKKLLEHSDRNLRLHAFRMLSRMDEPGMALRWKDSFGHASGREFLAYLKKHKDERRVFEKRVMELGEPAWNVVRYMQTGPIFSLDFVRAFAATKIAPGTAVAYVGYQVKDEGFDQLVAWVDGDDLALSDAALDWLLYQGRDNAKADVAFHGKVLRRLMDRLGAEKNGLGARALEGFRVLSARMPVKTVLDALELVLEDVETHGGLLQDRRGAYTLLNPIASAADAQDLSPDESARYAALLMRWLALGEKSNAVLEAAGTRGRYFHVKRFATHMGHALGFMAEEKALSYARRLFSVPGRSSVGDWRMTLPAANDPRAIRILAAGIAAAPEGERRKLFEKLNKVPSVPPSRPYMDAIDQARLTLVDVLSAAELGPFFQNYYRFMGKRSSAEVQRQFLRLLEKARALSAEKREAVLVPMFTGGEEYFEKVLAPLAESEWEHLDRVERKKMLGQAMAFLGGQVRGKRVREHMWDVAARVLRPHLAEIDAAMLYTLNRHRTRFPLESWLPLMPEGHANWIRTQLYMTQEEGDEIARRMVADPKRINRNVLTFVSSRASAALQREIFDGLLRSKDAARRGLALTVVVGSGAGQRVSEEALEDFIALELAAEPVDLDRLHEAGQHLLKLRPSEKLFPVAHLLLGSTIRKRVLSGISMANSLGRKDLVPDLLPHLSSMDSQVRVAAKKAVAAIRALGALEKEMQAEGK